MTENYQKSSKIESIETQLKSNDTNLTQISDQTNKIESIENQIKLIDSNISSISKILFMKLLGLRNSPTARQWWCTPLIPALGRQSDF